MSKIAKEITPATASDSFEIIELAIDDIEVLTRAFTLIQEVCEERDPMHLALSEDLEKVVIN